MVKYPIKVQARIKKEQYDKIIATGMDKSEYIRDAIDFFDCDAKKEVELSKIKLLDELKESFALEHKNYNEYLKQQALEQENIMNSIKEEYDECYDKLEQIRKEEEEYDRMNIKKPVKRSREEIIEEILPTLQGFYYSETGITYEKLCNLGHKVDISPEVLLHWTNQNKELLEKGDYLNRDVIKHEKSSISRIDKI